MKLTADRKERLDRFLLRHFPDFSRSRLQSLVSEGQVLVEGVAASKSGLELRPGWAVDLEPPAETEPHNLEPADIPLEALYEDAEVLVVNKPRGLATHPARSLKAPSLVNALLARPHGLSAGDAPFRPGIVHRLDRETTGVIVVAKTDRAQTSLSAQIRARSISRVYVARILGEPMEDEFTVDAPIARDPARPTRMAVVRSGKPAVTHVRVLARHGDWTLVACKLETGRTHQIRVHLAACHMPVIGDKLYAAGAATEGPLQLHAALLAFDHPTTGGRTTVYAPAPMDFLAAEEVTRAAVEEWT